MNEWSKSASHYAWGTNGAYKWMQDGCKVYMNSYMASNESCFMVTWIIFKNHLLEVGLTQNRETMALQTLTTVNLFNFIMREDPHEHKFIETHLVEGPVTYDFTIHLRVVTTLLDVGDVLGRPLNTFFWALTISWSRLSARAWSGPWFWAHLLCIILVQHH
jgi:hypothetical protein